MPEYIKIHEYPLERLSFGDDDFYDVDYWDGTQYQSAKIKGSVIKAGIISAIPTSETIYSADGVISGDRVVDADGHFLTFDNVTNLRFNTQGAPFGVSGFEINGTPTGNLFTVKNAGTGALILKVSGSSVFINNEYALPNVDGSSGQVMTTDGAGNLSWTTPAVGGDMFKSVYDPNNDGIVESARKEMVAFINKTGSTITKGTIVFLKATSASTNFPEVVKANANSEATSSKTIGAVYEDVANDATGFVVTSGEVDNLNTSGYSIGQRLWLATTDGQVTTTPPTQPNHTVFIGIVTRSQNVNGRVLYAIQNGYELGELHDVLLTGLVDGQTLAYDSVDGLWKNVSPSSPTQIELPAVINVLNTPPSTPTDGDRYRIGTAPTGLWVGNANNLAQWDAGTSAWIYETPVADNLVYQTATATTFRYNGTGWIQWAGTPILQNGNTLGGVARIGTNDNFNVILKRNNTDTFSVGATLFSQRNAGGTFGTFNLGGVTSFQNWNLPNASGTIALTSDLKLNIQPSEIRRGFIAVSGSTTIGTFGALTEAITGSVFAVTFGGVVPLPKVRFYTIAGSTNSVAGIRGGASGNVLRLGQGFRFIGSWIYSDQSTGGTNWYVPTARQFCGLATGLTLLPISSTTTLQSQPNIIGIGSDAGDTNLHIFHNGGTPTATKIDLGSNFPANKASAVANGEAYQLYLFNEFGSNSVEYRVRRLSNGFEVSGTIVSNLPASVDLGAQLVRTSGSTSQNVSVDMIQLTSYTLR